MQFFEQGTYRATITNATITTAKTGTHQVELNLELHFLHGKNPGEQLAPRHTRFPPRLYLAITDATMGTATEPGWVAQTLAFLGFQGDFACIDSVVGWVGDVYCEPKPNNKTGEVNDSWSIVRNPTQDRKPPEQSTVRQLNAQYQKQVRACQSTKQPALAAPTNTTPMPPPQGALPPADDEIPF
jgi:hypothetical protein